MNFVFKICMFLWLYLVSLNCFGQQVEYNFSIPSPGKYSLSTKYEDLGKNKTYTFVVRDINTAYFDVKFSATSKNLKSSIPDVLKGVIPGFPGEIVFGRQEGFLKANESLSMPTASGLYDTEFREAMGAYEKLRQVVDLAQQLLVVIKANPDGVSGHRVCVSDAGAKQAALENALGAGPLTHEAALKVIERLKQQFTGNVAFISEAITIRLPAAQAQGVLNNYKDLQKANQVFTSNKDLYAKSVDVIYHTLTSNNFSTKEFQVTKEVTSIKITVVDKFKGDTVLTRSFDYFYKGGLDFDVTTGFFASNLYSKSYYINRNNPDGSRTIEREDSPGFDLGIGALAHLNYKFSSAAKGGLCVGAYLSTFDTKTRYLIGPSFVFFRKNQLAVSGGLVIGKISKLSGAVSSNGDKIDRPLPADISSAPMYDKWKTGYFGAITYNLTRD